MEDQVRPSSIFPQNESNGDRRGFAVSAKGKKGVIKKGKGTEEERLAQRPMLYRRKEEGKR